MADFEQLFRLATATSKHPNGHSPMLWQQRLFEQFCRNDLPKIVDLPTGLGKTNIIHVWFLALICQIRAGQLLRLPTRLVYVVDRRTVVDQATEAAESIARKLQSLGCERDWLAVSTLRGQRADNREWLRDPCRPAIIIGTIDMIGSRLLFSGYRSSYKLRPLEAGLLGQDALLILDEAHLSEPFAALTRHLEDWNLGSLFVIHMSATATNGVEGRFSLLASDLEGDRETNSIIRRYEAEKTLIIHEGVADSHRAMVNAAMDLAKKNMRVVIFVRSPETAAKIADAIRATGLPVATLTGTMRGWERDRLLDPERASERLEGQIMQRFLEPSNRAEEGPVILVSTSAGEVGFDLNADHLVCDPAPLDSMIQRLGRVNRRGDGKAEARLFAGKIKEQAKKQSGKQMSARRTVETASAAAIEALKRLPKIADGIGYDASPQALASLAKPEDAISPKPATIEVTDILVDTWSMTSITKPMPGRPPVAPWLRGIDDEMPQTTIAWRTELDLFDDRELNREAVEMVFQKHRIRPHETLTTRSDHLLEFLKRAEKKRPSLKKKQALLLTDSLTPTSIGELMDDPSPLRSDPTLILPGSFGGIDDAGMLDEKCVASESGPDDFSPPRYLDVADEPGYERSLGDLPRLRLLVERTEDSWAVKAMPGATLPSGLDGIIPGELTSLIDVIKARLQRNLRLRQPLKFDKEGNATTYLLSLYPFRAQKSASRQLLDEHVGTVESCAARIAEQLRLTDPYLSALKFAAKYHDEGKKARTWQYAIGNKETPDQPLGKSGGRMSVKRLGGYRHEFGSLLRITDSTHQAATELPPDPQSRDLALHLIAAHHGSSRPHFARPVDFDYADRKRCPQMSIESLRRFARLQRHYGHWRLAWLENLLRCADAMASAENEDEET
ncbi:MAG TPA: type I-U CRISPR-associated helicase/endonuclease Cas3 [Bryobacteraceae bacterium]|nr:type I-U CRISPR-associated helicase/endonuclease Cas3 [Bryobacteraceae bacterium]